MRLSELSTTTGVSVASLKYYLREGLLPPGDVVSRTESSTTTGTSTAFASCGR